MTDGINWSSNGQLLVLSVALFCFSPFSIKSFFVFFSLSLLHSIRFLHQHLTTTFCCFCIASFWCRPKELQHYKLKIIHMFMFNGVSTNSNTSLFLFFFFWNCNILEIHIFFSFDMHVDFQFSIRSTDANGSFKRPTRKKWYDTWVNGGREKQAAIIQNVTKSPTHFFSLFSYPHSIAFKSKQKRSKLVEFISSMHNCMYGFSLLNFIVDFFLHFKFNWIFVERIHSESVFKTDDSSVFFYIFPSFVRLIDCVGFYAPFSFRLNGFHFEMNADRF